MAPNEYVIKLIALKERLAQKELARVTVGWKIVPNAVNEYLQAKTELEVHTNKAPLVIKTKKPKKRVSRQYTSPSKRRM
jgi:hypothetical protein